MDEGNPLHGIWILIAVFKTCIIVASVYLLLLTNKSTNKATKALGAAMSLGAAFMIYTLGFPRTMMFHETVGMVAIDMTIVFILAIVFIGWLFISRIRVAAHTEIGHRKE